MVTTAFIGIGCNVGNREDFVRRAVEMLGVIEGVRVERVSSLYETSPIGGPPQRSFINAVARISTTLSPRDLLASCKAIERALGREDSEIRWGPRVADLDVLLFGDKKINEPDLEIPHPRMSQRRFVLVPLLEIEPEAADPWGGRYDEWVNEAEGEVRPVEPF
jgi:2-amino-4-hydroxy-6-hydroxymethyldihydropteridine diphosphokinase